MFVHQRLHLAVLIAATVVLLTIARGYLPFVADDALISFGYSERLLDGKGLTFTDGERVEGYSNLLWVLIVAAGGLFTSDLILVGRVAGTIGMSVTLAALLPVLRAPATPAAAGGVSALTTVIPALAGLSVLALSDGIAIWAIGGLEQAIQTPLLAWALSLLIVQRTSPSPSSTVPLAAGVLLALLVWTRPDGALFVALAAAALVAVHGFSRATLRGILRLAALPALAWLAQLAFRVVYYNDWIPNTAYAKIALSSTHVLHGLHYIGASLWSHAAIVIAAAAGLVFARPFRRREIVLPLVVAIGWTAYVISVGGDIFPGHRHFLPVLVCLAFLVAVTWRQGFGRLPLAAQLAVLVVLGAIHVRQQRADQLNQLARTERFEWDCGAVMSSLRTAFTSTQPLIAAEAVGCVGYFGKLPTLDMMGLTDRYLAHHPPAGFGGGFIGHELGDGRYVLSRSPDIVSTCVPGAQPIPCYRSSQEMFALPEFQQRYALVAMHRPEISIRPYLWFDTTSPRLGVIRTDREIRLPGFLFAAPDVGYVTFSREGKLVARLYTETVATLDKHAILREGSLPSGRLSAGRLPSGLLPAGSWTGRAIASQPMEVKVDGSSIRVTTGLQGGELTEVVLTR